MLDQAQNREPIDGGLCIHLPAHTAGDVAALAATEQQYCAFFTFTLHLSAGELQLDVRAPDQAAPLLADLVGAIG